MTGWMYRDPKRAQGIAGIELVDGTLVVDRQPNVLAELAIRFTDLLDALGIDNVYVSGYVVILTGRSRATEDIGVLLERVDKDTVDELVVRLEEEGFWGPRDAARADG